MRNYDGRKNYFEDFRLCRICKTIQKYKILKLQPVFHKVFQ